MALVLFDLNGTLLDPGPRTEGIQAGVRLAMIHTLAGTSGPWAPPGIRRSPRAARSGCG